MTGIEKGVEGRRKKQLDAGAFWEGLDKLPDARGRVGTQVCDQLLWLAP